jgi:steroid delta-isomerase-like uncharacterized protein
MDTTPSSSRQLVQQYYNYFNQQNWEGMLSLLAEDVVHEVNQGGIRKGIALYREFLAHMDACYQENLSDMVVMADESGARIACEFVVHGVYKKTDAGLPEAAGQTYTLPAGAFLAIANGKISRVTTYYNLTRWLQLVGAH